MPRSCPGAAAGYKPRAASDALKGIVADHFEALLLLWDERFLKQHGRLHNRLQKLFDAFLRCGKGMKVVSSISSPAQDAVIEKILRARDEWEESWVDPPHPED